MGRLVNRACGLSIQTRIMTTRKQICQSGARNQGNGQLTSITDGESDGHVRDANSGQVIKLHGFIWNIQAVSKAVPAALEPAKATQY
jgi:hypothetical protein